MRFVLILLSIIGFVYGIIQDYLWLKLLTGGYLTSTILLGASKERNDNDTFFSDYFDDSNNISFWDGGSCGDSW